MPVALPAGRAGPGGNILVAGGHGPPDKSLSGRSRPWIKFSAREPEKYINFTKILIIFAIWKIIQFELLIGRSAGNYIKWKIPKSVNFFNENLNFNFFYDKKVGFFLKLGPQAGQLDFRICGHGRARAAVLKNHGQRAAGGKIVTYYTTHNPQNSAIASYTLYI